MKPIRVNAVVAACCSVFVACGGSQPATTGVAQFELAAAIPPAADTATQIEALRTTLAGHSSPTVVVAHDEVLAAAALAAHLDARIVAIVDTTPAKTGPMPFDGVVVPATGAAVAIDAAILACNNIAMPSRVLPIGARWFTAANLAAGGASMPASGDPLLALLRNQHATVLTTHPTTTEVNRVGFEQFGDRAWHVRARDEAVAAATDHPQIELQLANANGDLATQARQLRTFLHDGCKAILVSTDDPSSITAITIEAAQRGVTMLVLDPQLGEHGTCCIGSDPTAIGRAAGQAIRQLQPAGCRVVELLGSLPPRVAEQRHQGLGNGLGAR